MTPQSSAVLPLALVAGAMVLTVAACGGGVAPSPTTTTSSQPSAIATTATPVSVTPAVSVTPTDAGTPGTGSGAGGTDRCDPMNLLIRYADDEGGAGAGSVMGTFTILNRGSTSCTLRGFPGVSYVGGVNGVQVGEPATRTGDAVTLKTVAPQKKATVALRRTQPRNYGEQCQEAKVTGFRVYLPDSTQAGFVPFATTGCRSTTAPLLQVGPVR